ncbi:PHAF1 protein CG7083 [Coccinella septempunctata]|uniref:PHAF1 protein CG7083 n=1 Tax=Coccinella septempunctata TaxID=41139 RepID=UPI001D091D81|nr:PHAF1 protein CG7083 [Coccinella septempunctata]
MLCLDVIPEFSLGCDQWQFVLGMHFSQAVAIIQLQVGKIKGVQVLYNDTDPLTVDMVINLSQDGIRLFFDPNSQRLKLIEIYSMKSVKLKYCSKFFSSPEVVPTYQVIEEYFGATHPGLYDEEKQLFMLNFRGLTFYFPVNTKFLEMAREQVNGDSKNTIGSLNFPCGTSAIVSRVAIYSGQNIDNTAAPELPLSCFYGQVYLEKAVLLRGQNRTKGIKLNLVAASHTRLTEASKKHFERTILLGQSAQEITSAIGCPSKVFYKSEDKMKIHSPNNLRSVTADLSDYFFNYFTLGLDLLFDARTNLVKKLVLHTNYPGHYNFNMYMRCEFTLALNGTTVDASSKWNQVCENLTPSDQPVVLNRASSTNTINPFGSTFCYGYEDIIFEVLPNNYIGSLSIFGDGRNYQIAQHNA